MFKRIIAPLALLLAVAGGVLAIAPVSPPPSAAPVVVDMPAVELASFSSCTFGQGCLYVDHNGGGAVYSIVFSQVGGNHCVNLFGQFDESISSSVETIGSGWRIELYGNANCGGANWSAPDNSSAEYNFFKDNAASSFKLIQ